MNQVIIVDDDIGILEPMTIMLQNAGYTVTAFLNGDPILDLNFTTPDIFIIDKQLAGLNGLDLCRFLKEQEDLRHIPVIMISADRDIAEHAEKAGANASLEKPFKMKDLRDTVAMHLNK
jgi:DNA-binding response OmpR family regulator